MEPDPGQVIRQQTETIRRQAQTIRLQEDTIRRQERIIARQQARIAELEQLVARLTARVEDLSAQVARLSKNSSNSSKPPSSDITKPPREAPPRNRGHKVGGQPGHARHERPPFAPDEIDRTCIHEFPPDEVRRRRLTPLKTWFVLQQVELVEKPYEVVEHRARRYMTPSGRIVLAPMAPQVRGSGLLGPNLTALVGWLKACGHMSYRRIGELLRDVFGLPISGGKLVDCTTDKLSEALRPAYDELAAALRGEDVLGSDETGHYHAGKRFWTWCLRAARFTVFRLDPHRSARVLEDLLGEDFGGILTVDYYSANRAFARDHSVRTQYCWSHLLRDIKFLLTLGRASLARWADALLAIARRLFRLWHRRSGADPPRWRRQMERLKRMFLEKIRRPPQAADAMKLARRFDRQGAPAYFRFLDSPGVEPTNNATERAIRQPVLDRRITQGTRSPRGLRWCERAWTVAATCSQQGRSAFRFFRDALVAHLTHAPAPSLLPVNP